MSWKNRFTALGLLTITIFPFVLKFHIATIQIYNRTKIINPRTHTVPLDQDIGTIYLVLTFLLYFY